MSTLDKIRIGVIGAGAIGNVHMAEYHRNPEFDLVAVADNNLPLSEKSAGQFDIPKVYTDAQELIADEQIDAVAIGVPNKWHAPLATQALRAGKHVLLEKPMGLNSDAAKEIVRAQRETGNVVMISHQLRWEWMYMAAKEQVEKGALGHIYSAKAGAWRRKGIPGWGSWFTRKSESGGGPLIDIGVHYLDLTLWLMGNPKPVSVFGSTYAEFGPKKRGIGEWGTPKFDGYYDVEDLATALIKMEDGSTVSLDVSWAVHMDTDNTPFIHLMGSEGGVSLHRDKATLLTEAFDRPIDVEMAPPEEDEGSRARLSNHFASCIREGAEPLTSAMTGLTNNLILDAIYESSRTGHEVKIDWDF